MFALWALSLGAIAHAGPPSRSDSAAEAGPVALAGVEAGAWELRVRNAAGAAPRRLCVADPRVLLQLRHADRPCRRFIIDDASRHAAVAYHCPDGSNGRTDIRVETARLVQIDTQGVEDGMPFALTIEARRIGACGGVVAGY